MHLFNRKEPARTRKTILEVRHEAETYQVHLRRTDNARRFILRVRGATQDVVLTMPRRASIRDATDFAARNAAWIGARMQRLPERIAFINGAEIPLRGQLTKIIHRPNSRGIPVLTALESAPMESHDPAGPQQGLCVTGEERFIERRVQDWLRAQCRQDLSHAIKHYAALAERPAPPFSLRDTTSRWGSCSSRGVLNFSWRLILAPPEVLRYLVAHEVSHLIHMNHSAQFWAFCRNLCSETDTAERWLKMHGSGLHRYGLKTGPRNKDD